MSSDKSSFIRLFDVMSILFPDEQADKVMEIIENNSYLFASNSQSCRSDDWCINCRDCNDCNDRCDLCPPDR